MSEQIKSSTDSSAPREPGVVDIVVVGVFGYGNQPASPRVLNVVGGGERWGSAKVGRWRC